MHKRELGFCIVIQRNALKCKEQDEKMSKKVAYGMTLWSSAGGHC
jgi:hypothetical protein